MENNILYYNMRVHTYTELNQVLIWLNSLIYMIYKNLHITTYRFGQPSRTYALDLISNQSAIQLVDSPTNSSNISPMNKISLCPEETGEVLQQCVVLGSCFWYCLSSWNVYSDGWSFLHAYFHNCFCCNGQLVLKFCPAL